MLEDLFTKGWVVLVDDQVDLTDAAGYLKQKYLGIFPQAELVELTENFRVEDYDRITEWHNDSNHGMNLTFLYYLDAMSPETGGSISLRNTGTDEEVKIYPQAHQLIIMSQKPYVLHRAEACSIRRHMFNIDFKVKGL